MTDQDTKPGLDERYTSARNSKDLTVASSELPNRDSDVLAAAAWTQSRVGHMLMQLHSEWDSAEKPPKPTPNCIKSMVGTFQTPPQGFDQMLDDSGRPLPLTAADAKAYADAWYRHEISMLLGKLKRLPAVREKIRVQAEHWGWADAGTGAAEVLRWWLDQKCNVCLGTKWTVVPGTNRHGGKLCSACGGSGFSEVPCGQPGKKLANWMDEGVNVARRRIRKALQNHRN